MRTATSNSIVTANQYRYIGGEREGSLYRLGARYYDPSLGAFTQPDPSGLDDNLYSYASANPVAASDPSGLLTWWDIFWSVVGTLGCSRAPRNIWIQILCGLMFTVGVYVVNRFNRWFRWEYFPAMYREFCWYFYRITGGYNVCR